MGIIDNTLNWLEKFIDGIFTNTPVDSDLTPAEQIIQPLPVTPTQPDLTPAPVIIEPIEQVSAGFEVLQPNTPSKPEPAEQVIPVTNQSLSWRKELTYGYFGQRYVNDYFLTYGGAQGTPFDIGTKAVWADGVSKADMLKFADEIEAYAKGGTRSQPSSQWNMAAIADANTIRGAL